MPEAYLQTFIDACRGGASPCLIISGERNSGKTTRFGQLVQSLQSELGLAGIIAESSSIKDSYSARNLTSGEVTVLMEESGQTEPGDFVHKRFIVHQSRFDTCTADIIASYKEELIAIDEVGEIELGGRGWFRLLSFARQKPLLITVREQFVDDVKERLLGARNDVRLVGLIGQKSS